MTPPTTAEDYGKLGHFIVSAPIVFLSVSLSGSSPSLSRPFFSLYLNYFSSSPLFPSSASSPILIARLAGGHRQNRADLVLTAALTITSPPPLRNISHRPRPQRKVEGHVCVKVERQAEDGGKTSERSNNNQMLATSKLARC